MVVHRLVDSFLSLVLGWEAVFSKEPRKVDYRTNLVPVHSGNHTHKIERVVFSTSGHFSGGKGYFFSRLLVT